MKPLIGRVPYWFPFPLTIFTLIVDYAIAVLINELVADVAYVSAILFVLLFIIVYYVIIDFVLYNWKQICNICLQITLH